MSTARPVRISVEAREDLAAIWNHISPYSERNADRFVRRLLKACYRLGRWPHSGRPLPDLGEGLRGYPESKRIIIYRVSPTEVEILHIFHGARDLRSAMGGRD